MQLLGALLVLSSLPGAPNQGWAPQLSSAQTQPCCTPVVAVLCSSSNPCPPAPAIPAGDGSSPAVPSVSQQDVGDVGLQFSIMATQRPKEDLAIIHVPRIKSWEATRVC